jgi:hypothetical protein
VLSASDLVQFAARRYLRLSVENWALWLFAFSRSTGHPFFAHAIPSVFNASYSLASSWIVALVWP